MWALACMCRSEVDSRRAAGAEIVAAAKKQVRSGFVTVLLAMHNARALKRASPGGKCRTVLGVRVACMMTSTSAQAQDSVTKGAWEMTSDSYNMGALQVLCE